MEDALGFITLILTLFTLILGILLKFYNAKKNTQNKILRFFKKPLIKYSVPASSALFFILYMVSFFIDDEKMTTYEINNGKPLSFKSNDTLTIKRIGGPKSKNIFISIDEQILRFSRIKGCNCWRIPIESFSGIKEGNHSILIGNQREWVRENHLKNSEKLIIDDTPPELNVNIEKNNFNNDKLDLKISGQSNEEVNIELDFPINGESYVFSSKKDSINNKVVYSFTYDIFDLEYSEEIIAKLDDFIILFNDNTNNSISYRENARTFLKVGIQNWTSNKSSFLVEKKLVDGQIRDIAKDESGISDNYKNEILRIKVKLISSRHIQVNWKLSEGLNDITYSVYRDGELLERNNRKNTYDDFEVKKDSSYVYAVEAVSNNKTVARSKKIKQYAWVTVSNDGSGDFTIIQEAINASNSGIIFLREGIYWKRGENDRQDGVQSWRIPNTTYNEMGVLTLLGKEKDEIKIIGENPEYTIIDGSKNNAHSGIYIDQNVKSVIVKNITIRNFKNLQTNPNGRWTGGKGIFHGVFDTNSLSNLEVLNCKFENLQTAIKLDFFEIENNVEIESSYFKGNNRNIYLKNFSERILNNNFIVRNNIFFDSFIESESFIVKKMEYGHTILGGVKVHVNFLSCQGNSFFNVNTDNFYRTKCSN